MSNIEIASASVRVIPDFSAFDAQVLAHATAAAKTIEATLAKANIAGGATGKGAAGLAGVTAATGPAVTGLDKVTKASDNVDKSFQRSSKSLSGFNTVAGQSARFLLPISVAFGILAFKAVQSTSAIVEAVNAVNVAFGESSGEIQAFARNLADTDTFFGLTERAALDAAASFGLFLDDIVKSKPLLANLSEQLITAAADVGSLFNVETTKVLADFQSGLQGQTRVVRKYGLDISAAATEQEAYRLGIAETGTELSEQEKRLSRMSLILHGAAIAAGDAELTQNTFAGALRNTNVAIAGAVNQLGKQLLPIAQRVVEVVGGLADGFRNLSGFSQRLIISFGLIATAAGPTLLIISKLVPLFGALVPAIQRFVIAVQAGTLALGPQIAVLLGIAAAVAALKFALDAPTRAEETSRALEDLARDAQALNSATSDGAAAAKTYKEGLAALGLADIDFTSFDDIVAKVDLLNEKLAQGPPEKERRGAGGIFAFTDELAAGIDSIITGVTDSGIDIIKTVLGEDPDKGLQQIDATTVAINGLKAALTAKNLPDAQALIAGTKDLNIRQQLQKVYDEEIVLLAERKVKQDAANDAADRAIQAAIDQIDPTEKLNRLFKEGVENLNDLLTAQTSVTSAEKSLRSARAALGNAQQRLNKLLREGKFDLDKIKNAEDALLDVTNRRIEADKQILITQQELAKLREPATADELAEATDNITKAEIALAKAKRDTAAALKELEPRQRTSLNLQGLSLDQLRITLANERATLAAQRQTQQGTGEDPATKIEEATLAAIAEREAERSLAEARADLTEVQEKGSESDQEVIDKRDELTRATVAATKAAREEVDARKKLAEVKAGDPDFEARVAEARQAIADAGTNAAEAAERLADANIRLREQEGLLAGDLKATNIALRDRLLLNKDLLGQQLKNEAFLKIFVDLLQRTGPVFPFGPTPGGGDLFDAAAIARSLLNDPRSPFREVFRRLGIPGFFAEGAVLDRPTFGVFAEKGREGLIPFTKPKRAATLLVGAREFPAIEEQIAKLRVSSGAPSPNRITGSGGGLTFDRPGDSEVATVLREILGQLQSRPLDGPPINVHPTPGMSESQLARKVQRELQRYWGNG